MAEKRNLTEEMIAENKERHAREDAEKARIAQEKAEEKARIEAERGPKPPMNKAVPYFVGGAVFLVLGFPFRHLAGIIVSAAFAFAAGWILKKKRDKQVAAMPKMPEIKNYTEEVASKIAATSKNVKVRADKVENDEVRGEFISIAATLEKIADEVEKDPNDRNKVRKLANHYGQMIVELMDKYIALQDKKEVATEGENIRGTISKLEETFKGSDEALKKMLDSMFSNDAIEVSADITALESLMGLDTEKKVPTSDQGMNPVGFNPAEFFELTENKFKDISVEVPEVSLHLSGEEDL